MSIQASSSAPFPRARPSKTNESVNYVTERVSKHLLCPGYLLRNFGGEHAIPWERLVLRHEIFGKEISSEVTTNTSPVTFDQRVSTEGRNTTHLEGDGTGGIP